MATMTSRERIYNTLHRKPVDHCGFHESIWGDTVTRWKAEGHIKEGDNLVYVLGMDISNSGWINSEARLDREWEIVEEDEQTKLVRNGNGALLRWWKNKSGTPEHVDFLVQDRASWEEHIKPYMVPDRRRVNFEAYRIARREAAERNTFFVWAGVNVFEMMHPICGHEYMLMGMALDPDWIKMMARQLSDLTIGMWEMLFAEEGMPDAIWFFEDMGFKDKPFMSPAMYREIIMPEHKRTFEWAHQRGLKVIVHSCGMVESLVPGLIEAGMDMLQAMEVKAGMDMLRLNKQFGDRIGFMGNIDIREVISNDRSRIDAELQRKILPLMKSRTPFIISSDHSTPPEVDFETFLYFRDKAQELARYS